MLTAGALELFVFCVFPARSASLWSQTPPWEEGRRGGGPGLPSVDWPAVLRELSVSLAASREEAMDLTHPRVIRL